MWSLPDINRMNEEATSGAFKRKIRDELSGRSRLPCLICDKPSTKSSRQKWFDIFSDDPKGVVGLCKRHEEYYDSAPEGYFYCNSCNRLFIENYTWECYSHDDDALGTVCLNCRAESYLADDDNWIPLLSVGEGNDRPYSPHIENLTFAQVRKSPHLIAVSGPCPAGIELHGNVELDSTTGGRIIGFSDSEASPESGVEELREMLRCLRDAGHTEAILILDAAYQFAVSIGVYVRKNT